MAEKTEKVQLDCKHSSLYDLCCKSLHWSRPQPTSGLGTRFGSWAMSGSKFVSIVMLDSLTAKKTDPDPRLHGNLTVVSIAASGWTTQHRVTVRATELPYPQQFHCIPCISPHLLSQALSRRFPDSAVNKHRVLACLLPSR